MTVGGQIQASLTPDNAETVWFKVKEDCQLIKVMAEDEEGPFNVAILLLHPQEVKKSWRHRLLGYKRHYIVLNDEQQIRVDIKFTETEEAEEGEYLIGIGWQKNLTQSVTGRTKWVTSFPSVVVMHYQLALLAFIIAASVALILLVRNGELFINPHSGASEQTAVVNPELDRKAGPAIETVGDDHSIPTKDENVIKEFESQNKALTISLSANGKKAVVMKIDLNSQSVDDSYTAKVRINDAEAEKIWQGKQTFPTKSDQNGKTISIEVPMGLFKDCCYNLVLEAANKTEEKYPFCVKVTPPKH